MASKSKSETNTTDKILSSDIYELTSFVDDIKKKNIDGIDDQKETLLTGIYGYLGYEFTSILQNAIVVASELSNEAIPTRAKFDRNVITHALSLGVKKVSATPASMKVLLLFPEKNLRNNMVDGVFTLFAKTPITFDNYEFHTDYDIKIYYTNLGNSTNGTTMSQIYTAKYVIDWSNTNPISSIDNEYLPPVAVFNTTGNDRYIGIMTTLHQVQYTTKEIKIVGNDEISNKTINFDFDDQMAYFKIKVQEKNSDEVTELIPVYDGLYNQQVNKYCYYQYINSNTIRIRFDPTIYQPKTNCNVIVEIFTTLGSEGNFEYSEDLMVRLNSDEYVNLYMIVQQRNSDPDTGIVTGGSVDGMDRKTIEELQQIIPKEALSRGFITTLTDLKNYFNSINNENSVIHVFRKEDNILNRIYYTYCLMKDTNFNVVPTNTIPIYVDDTTSSNAGRLRIESGEPIYYYKRSDLGSSSTGSSLIDDHYLGYRNQVSGGQESYTGWDQLSSLRLNPGDIINIHYQTSTPTNRFITVERIGEVLSINNYNNTNRIESIEVLCQSPYINKSVGEFDSYTLKFAMTSEDHGKTGFIVAIDKFINSEFLYTTPFDIELVDNDLVGTHRVDASYYMNIINESRDLSFKCINSKSPIQFISSYITVRRKSYLSGEFDRYKYSIKIQLAANIGSTSQFMSNFVQVIGVMYKNGSPAIYSIGKYLEDESTSDVLSYEFPLYTMPFKDGEAYTPIDDNNDIYLGSYQFTNGVTNPTDADIVTNFLNEYRMYDASDPLNARPLNYSSGMSVINPPSPIKSIQYMPLNSDFRIYVLYKYNVADAIVKKDYFDDLSRSYFSSSTEEKPLTNIVSRNTEFEYKDDKGVTQKYTLGQMVLTNVYDVSGGINLSYDYSNLMNSYVTSLDISVNNSGDSFIINRVPMIRYMYLTTQEKLEYFIKEIKRKINYVLNAIDPLESTFGLDFKFFNTYGPSNMYHITDQDGEMGELIDSVSLRLNFRAKFYNENQDQESVIPQIKDDIKAYIEQLDKLEDIHFPNLTTEIETKYSEYLIYFEFLGFNVYDANNQHIVTKEDMELLTTVPEFLCVDIDDYTELPRINIRIVT